MKMMKADVLVFGESAPGVAAAVRAAREGLTTLLVTQDEHFAGVLASLGAIETHYTGVRAPLLEELKSGIVRHYREAYGEDSDQYRQCVYLEPGNPMMTFEPSAALKVAREMVEAEDITVLHRYHPAAVELDRRRVRAVRLRALEWGLSKDEFTDNDNIPTHLYVREARRIWGRTTFTEHDALLASRSERTPVHADSVAVTDFPLDSLACTPERRPGTACDGQFFLQEQTRPAQVPYRVMLPERLDNLLVSVCCSVTHVAWGTVRQTPTLIQLAEAAGYAAALAKETRAQVADISVDALQRRLAENGHMLSFFNDFDMAKEASWVPAVQYLGTKGYFSSYDARPNDISTEAEAEGWLEHARRALPGMPENISLTGLKRGDAAEKLYALYKANATAPI